MNGNVRHGLAGRGSLVDADVESGRRMMLIRMLARAIDQRQNRRTLLGRGLEERFHVALRRDQAMAGRQRMRIENPQRVFVLSQIAIRGK